MAVFPWIDHNPSSPVTNDAAGSKSSRPRSVRTPHAIAMAARRNESFPLKRPRILQQIPTKKTIIYCYFSKFELTKAFELAAKLARQSGTMSIIQLFVNPTLKFSKLFSTKHSVSQIRTGALQLDYGLNLASRSFRVRVWTIPLLVV